MKKLVVVAAVAAMVFGSVGFANAAWWTEEYTGNQYVAAGGGSFDFTFDMLLPNVISGTTSSLTLTQDSIGAFNYDQGIIYGTLCDLDLLNIEQAQISLTTKGLIGGSWTDVFSDTVTFYDLIGGDFAYVLSAAQLDSLKFFDKVTISATDVKVSLIGSQNFNDFYITKVGMAVGVPEPATLLLLGAGLLGVAGLRRKRQ